MKITRDLELRRDGWYQRSRHVKAYFIGRGEFKYQYGDRYWHPVSTFTALRFLARKIRRRVNLP